MTDLTQKPLGTLMWVRIALGVSLALNLLVVGLVVGAMFRFGDAEGRRPPAHSIGAAMFRELPQEDRKALREDMVNRPTHSAASRATETKAIAAALREDPFDPDVVLAILNEQAQDRIDWQQSAQQAWLDRVEQMSVTDRADFADRLNESLSRHRKSGHRSSGRWWHWGNRSD